MSRETKTIQALGHDWGDWTVLKEPTFADQGSERRTCSICGETETRAIEALGFASKFREDVRALDAANTRSERWEAIRTALTTYEMLTDAERAEVAAEYTTLENAIASYNESAEAINTQMDSATELALGLIVSATMSALAAAWFILKKVF